MKTILLTRGLHTIVDDQDYDYLMQVKWYAAPCGKDVFYAARSYAPERKKELMHRAILAVPEGMEIDHINHNTLDNTRKNLRVCTHGDNMRNRRFVRPVTEKTGTTFYRGKWVSQITTARTGTVYLGTYLTQKEAHEAYMKARPIFIPTPKDPS